MEEAAPPGPLDAAEPPPLELPVVLEAAPPPLGALDDEAPPAPELLVPPIPLGLELEPGELGEVDDDELEPGAVGVVVDEEEDEPPGMTIVSFSLVTVLVGGLPPGTTAVVSLRSQAERARAPANTNR